MQRKNSKLDFSGQEIYVGVDLGKWETDNAQSASPDISLDLLRFF